jgi:DNA recombination protein RmuC
LQGQNAQEIARLAGDLCDKVSISLSDFNAVAEKIAAALSAHNEAVKRLATGKGNVLALGERIRGLGVKTKRPMPALLIDGIPLTAITEESGDDVTPETRQDSAKNVNETDDEKHDGFK